jgi:5-methylcytosine-specific restriction protein A
MEGCCEQCVARDGHPCPVPGCSTIIAASEETNRERSLVGEGQRAGEQLWETILGSPVSTSPAASPVSSVKKSPAPQAVPKRNQRPHTLCTAPGCTQYANAKTRRCAKHPPGREYDAKRPAYYKEFYASPRWREAREAQLRLHPLCRRCLERANRVEPATQADHIVPHQGNAELFFDFENNLQSLCGPCHSHKTATEDGGFGNARLVDRASE